MDGSIPHTSGLEDTVPGQTWPDWPNPSKRCQKGGPKSGHFGGQKVVILGQNGQNGSPPNMGSYVGPGLSTTFSTFGHHEHVINGAQSAKLTLFWHFLHEFDTFGCPKTPLFDHFWTPPERYIHVPYIHPYGYDDIGPSMDIPLRRVILRVQNDLQNDHFLTTF